MPPQTPTPPAPVPPAPEAASHGWGAAVGIAIVVVLLAAGGAYFFLMQSPQQSSDDTQLPPADAASPAGDNAIQAELNQTATTSSQSDVDALDNSL